MQQILPSLVTIGIAKTNRMVRQLPPFHQQEITPRLFQAGADLKPDKTRCCRNERQGLFSAAS